MPNDRFRINAPPDALDIHLLPKDLSNNRMETKSSEEDEEPKIYVNSNIISQAQGSAYIEYGNTKVLCGVYGPLEVTWKNLVKMEGQLDVLFKRAPFSSSARCDNQPTPDDRRITQVIKEALEPAVILSSFPKAKYEVNLLVLEDHNNQALSSAITCAGIALATAGVDMHDLVVGECLPGTQLSLATMPNLGLVTMLFTANTVSTGEKSIQEYHDLIGRGMNRCEDLAVVLKHHLKTKLEEELKPSCDI